jgi:hypothetical protein
LEGDDIIENEVEEEFDPSMREELDLEHQHLDLFSNMLPEEQVAAVTAPTKSKQVVSCFLCSGPHHFRDCSDHKEFLKWKKTKNATAAVDTPLSLQGLVDNIPCTIGLDSGAGISVMGSSLFRELQFCTNIPLHESSRTQVTLADTSLMVPILGKVITNVSITRPNGTFNIPQVEIHIIDTQHMHKVLLSHDVMISMGLDVVRLLDERIQSEVAVVGPSFLPECRVEAPITPSTPTPTPTEDSRRAHWFPAFSSLTASEQNKILDLEKYLLALPTSPDMTQPVLCEPHEITLKEELPPFSGKARTFPPAQMQYLRKHLDELLRLNWIVKAEQNCRYLSPIQVVPKPGGKYRMVIDLSRINKATLKAAHPLPRLDQISFAIGKSRYFCKVDIVQAYWQILLHLNSRKYCGFVTPFGVFQSTRMLMGAKNSASFFQRVLEGILNKLESNIVSFIYQDDILITGESIDDLVENIMKVIKILSEHRVHVNLDKCVWVATELDFCGRRLSQQGISISPERISSIMSLPKPTVASQLLHFLAATNYLRTSIPKFAIISAPLHLAVEQSLKARQSRKKSSIASSVLTWSDEMLTSFEAVKQALANAVTLAFPDLNKRVVIMSDASAVGLGYCITQVDDSWTKSDKPISEWPHEVLAVGSLLFSGAQTRWSIAEKEIYAVIFTIDRCQDLLYSNKGILFIVDSTTAAFYLAPSSHFDTLRVSLRDKLFRYRERFATLDYEIKVVPSIANAVSDYFSRYFGLVEPPSGFSPISLEQALNNFEPQISAVLLNSPADDTFHWPTIDQIRMAQERAQESINPLSFTFDTQRKLWMKGSQIFIPDQNNLRQRLMIVAHAGSSGHRRLQVALNSLSQNFYWDSLKHDLMEFVAQCLHCLSSKDGTKIPRPLGSALRAEKRNEVLAIDHLCMLNDSNLDYPTWACVMRDGLTGFVLIYPVHSTDAESTVTCLMEWIGIFGSPSYVVSDKGSAMKSHVFAKLLKAHGIVHHMVNIDSHSGNVVERTIRTILSVFRKLLSELQLPERLWSNYATSVQRTINNTPTPRLLGKAPIQVFIQLEQQDAINSIVHSASNLPEVSEDRLRMIVQEAVDQIPDSIDTSAIDAQHARNKKRLDAKAKSPHFTIGDFVLLSRKKKGPKLRPTWTGPFRVSDILTDYILELTDIRTKAITQAHVSRVTVFADSSYETTAPLLAQSIYYSTGNEVVKFSNIRRNIYTDEFELETVWLGVEDSTWENAVNMSQDAPTLVQKFFNQHQNNKLVKQMLAARQLDQGIFSFTSE